MGRRRFERAREVQEGALAVGAAIVGGVNLPAPHTTASIVSPDGTVLGYRQLGRGPALILLHGGMMAAQNFMKLGAALVDSFTVYIPDRRGRGSSGPYGNRYGIMRDCEDVRTLAQATGAERVFGLSSGAIIALETARVAPELKWVAAYEPPYSVAGRDNAEWLPGFDQEIARGDLAAAMVTVMKGTGDSLLLRLVPKWLVAKLMSRGIAGDAKHLRAGDVPIRELIPTMHYDALLVRETSPVIERLRELETRILLIGGSESAAFLRRALDLLESLLPNASRVTLTGVGHLAANNSGKPALVAEALRAFFA
jgi:pimeloyl-ACP methyl ester carboxylesterase